MCINSILNYSLHVCSKLKDESFIRVFFMREEEFLNHFFWLLDEKVTGLDMPQKLDLIRNILDTTHFDQNNNRMKCQIIPFIAGLRSIDEATSPGLGSSDHTALILESEEAANKNFTYILYMLGNLDTANAEELNQISLDASLSFCGANGNLITEPLPNWNKRQIAPAIIEISETGELGIKEIPLREAGQKRLVVKISPNSDLLPGKFWTFEELDEQIQMLSTEEKDPFSFGHMFSQRLLFELRLVRNGIPISSSYTWIDVCALYRTKSLYQRILDKFIIPDTEGQLKERGSATEVDYTYHPLYPILIMAMDNDELSEKALTAEIVYKKSHTTETRWLLRTTVYQKFLTALGMYEAIREITGRDLLSPKEREIYSQSPEFAEIRNKLNVKRWMKVIQDHKILFETNNMPMAGPVSAQNIVNKLNVCLAFLEAIGHDLKNAFEMTKTSEYNAQETIQRLFRDCERAVLRKTLDTFPEVKFLNRQVTEVLLWHERGKLEIPSLKWVPKPFMQLFGESDGIFVALCNKCRYVLNEVCNWAKAHNYMDYTGNECIPKKVSLLQAYLGGQKALIDRLQLRDGYAQHIEIEPKLPEDVVNITEIVFSLINEVPVFAMLTEQERRQLTRSARMITLAPMERIIVQGREGSSLFLVCEGILEALVRQSDGTDQQIGVLKRGDVIGEMSLLTGAPRSATVRAIDGAVVFEIGKREYEEIVRSRPEVIDSLANLMARRLEAMRVKQETYESNAEAYKIKGIIKNFFFEQ